MDPDNEPPSSLNSNQAISGNKSLDLVGSAKAQSPVINPELESESRIARDPAKSILARIDAYEDITDSEVGDTNLTRVRNLEREVGLRQVYLKIEGGNPTGSQKDRVAFAQVMDALRRGYDAVVAAAGPNYGAALSLAASLAGLKCYLYMPEAVENPRIQDLSDYKAEIITVAGDSNKCREEAKSRAEQDTLYDANIGGANSSIQLTAYSQIAHEIYDELRDAPAVVAVPVCDGTTLAGIYRGFLNLYRRGKTSRMPRLVAGASFARNPIIQAFSKNLSKCPVLGPVALKEKERARDFNYNWQAVDGDGALDAIRATNGWAEHVSDKSLLTYARMLRELDGLDVVSASCSGLVSLVMKHAKDPLPGDRYVAVLTGK